MLEILHLDSATIDMIIRLALAAGLGTLIGLERDVHGRNAGLRTHLLVCMGSALFMIISELIANRARLGADGLVPVNADPARIAAQIVTGIGFIGAGAILKSGFNVRGLTTAATLWIVASIGMATGTGAFAIAVITTLFTVFSLVLLNYFEKCYKKDSYRRLEIKTEGFVAPSEVFNYLKHKSVTIKSFEAERNYETKSSSIHITVRVFTRVNCDKVYECLTKQLDDSPLQLKSVKWHR